MEDESPVLVSGGSAAADGTQHGGTVDGFLAWFEKSRIPGLMEQAIQAQRAFATLLGMREPL